MKKRIISDSKCQIEVLVVLTTSQLEKMECATLRDAIDNIAKKMHVSWYVEKSGNMHVCVVGAKCTNTMTDDDMYQVEITSTNFMTAIDELEFPKEEPKEERDLIDFDDDEIAFVKMLQEDLQLPLENKRHITGALVVDTSTVPMLESITGWGQVGHDLLEKFVQLYLEKYDR